MIKYTRALDSVAIFDPSIATRNVGDEIISVASREEIRRVLPGAFQATIPTHERIGPRSWRFAKQARHRIIAGSNILTGQMLLDRQWRIRPQDTLFIKDLIGLGVGWRKYGQPKNVLSDIMMKRVLSKTGFHSVRDEHTRQELLSRGIQNVLNTACVTMWNLDVAGLAKLPAVKASRVVTTVNIGQQSEGELELVRLLCEEYNEVFLWRQGIDDEPYVNEICAKFPGVKRVSPNLAAYDELLSGEKDIDFVGNRLHGGVRALQRGRRALIFSVDNRASEIARDTNLPVVSLTEGLDTLRGRLRNPEVIDIKLPVAEIKKWRSQFMRPQD